MRKKSRMWPKRKKKAQLRGGGEVEVEVEREEEETVEMPKSENGRRRRIIHGLFLFFVSLILLSLHINVHIAS